MKKLVFILFIAFFIINPGFVLADDLDEDYLDISANYCILGEYTSALKYLNGILERDPNNKKAQDLKTGLTHIMKRDKKSFITNVNPYIKEAMEYKRMGDAQHELEALQAGTQSTNSYLAFYYLGNYYRNNNEPEKALDYYNKALSAKTNFAQAYLASAITLFDMGRYNSVINPIDKYLTYNEEDDLAYAIKSRAELQLGMLENARLDIDQAIEINDCPEYEFDRAKILYKYGNYQEAKDLFEKLLPDIQTSKCYEYLGDCYYELGDYVNALINIDRAFILSNDDQYLNNRYNEIKREMDSKS